MHDSKIQKLVMAALFAALTTVMTMVIRVPSPMGGYVNLGDCAVLLSAWILGPIYGSAAAGIGSMLADLIGYPLYAPGTLAIKAAMAWVSAVLFQKLRHGRVSQTPSLVISGLIGELIMVGGYFLYESLELPFFMGMGLGAAANIPFNTVQGIFGLVSSAVAYHLILQRFASTIFEK